MYPGLLQKPFRKYLRKPMTDAPHISVLMANYNNGHFFREAFESLINQTYQHWEAIVIDDASTDDSVAVIREIIKNDTRFRFYQNPVNYGYQKTVKRAIELSKAEIFGRLDPDDALHPEALRVSVRAHLENPAVGLVYSNIIYCDSALVPQHVSKGKQIESLDESYYNLDGTIWPFSTFKRKIYDRTSGIDISNRRAEDQDLYMKMCDAAPVKYIDADTYYYRIHDGGLSTQANVEKAFFWQWVAIVKRAERISGNVEDMFLKHLTTADSLAPYKQRYHAAGKGFLMSAIIPMMKLLKRKKT